jgi:hypothetical protein
MNTIKSLIAVGMAAALLNGFAVVVSADEASAESEAKAEVICETGAYGQNVNCKANTEAKAKAVVTRAGVPAHEVVATGLDGQGIALVVGTIATGVAATVAKFRLGK